MANNKLVYDLRDKPKFSKLVLYSFQMLLAILAATIAVPTIIGLPSQIPSAIIGAGIGTLVYVFFTKERSPVMLSSSFAFISSLTMAVGFGYMGIVVGGILAGLVYVVIAIIVKCIGTKWVNKLMPPVIIGPVVSLIGLSLATNSVADLTKSTATGNTYNLFALLCGLVTFFTVVVLTVQNKHKGLKLIPFIIGILVGYLLASIFTIFGNAFNVSYLKIIKWDDLINNFKEIKFTSFVDYPRLAIVEAIKELAQEHVSEAIRAANPKAQLISGVGIAKIALAFIPVAFVTFAEHLADHKNISSIIGRDLINQEPGLSRTLMGDGVGSIAGTALGICPNTTYGESVACVALTRNASVYTTIATAVLCILLSFITPFNKALATIPNCVMGGVCLALYGYISVSGLRMFKDVDLDDNMNLLTVCVILIVGIGGLVIKIPYEFTGDDITGAIELSSIASALILGICVFQLCKKITGRSTIISEVNANVKQEDRVRSYLKKFELEKLTRAMFIFGLMHENIDYTAATLSSFFRSKDYLNLRSREELIELINMFNLKGLKPRMSKIDLIKLINKDCFDIDKKDLPKITGIN